MRKQNIFPALAIILMAIAIFSVGCSKTGPTGATGPQGLQGTAGPTVSQGPKGNANVHVDTFSLSSSQWLWNDNYVLFTGGGSFTEWFTRYYKATVAHVTQGILDSGMVLVYMTPNTGDQDQWSPLPYMFDTGLGYAYEFVYVTSPGGIELEFFFCGGASLHRYSSHTE